VAKALTECRGSVELLLKAKKEAEAKFGTNVEKIIEALSPHAAVLKRLHLEVHKVDAVVTKVKKRKADVESLRAQNVGKARQVATELMDRLEVVDADVAAMADTAEPEEVAECNAASKDASVRIVKLLDVQLPKIKETDLMAAGVNLDLEGDIANPCPEIDGMLGEVIESVKTAETKCEVVLKVRREFAKAVEELKGPRQEAKTLLDGLQEPARRVAAAGLLDVSHKIDTAVALDYYLEQLLNECKEVAVFKAKAAEFTAAVQAATEAVKSGQAELERREKERAERRKLLGYLDDVQLQSAEQVSRLRKEFKDVMGEALRRDMVSLTECSKEVATLRQDSEAELETFGRKVKELLSQFETTNNDLEQHMEEERTSRRERFAGRLQAFGGGNTGCNMISTNGTATLVRLVNKGD
jgi:hypothetical protein